MAVLLRAVVLLFCAATVCECGLPAARPQQPDAATFQISVDGAARAGFIRHFWESTGFCPPLPHQNFSSYFLSDDETQNLAHIGATPNSGIQQVRIHWLLDLITAEVMPNGSISYNFSNLDQAIDMLHSNGLKPGFEIMGNPSSIFSDFENKTQVYAWRDLVAAIAQRYIEQYGLEYVSSWNFETWNEPDNGDFDDLKFTIQGYLNYYDACLEGLRSVHPDLQLGTPAESCHIGPYENTDPFCLAVLTHCYNGTNYFTGQGGGVETDYLSFHLKGSGLSQVIISSTIDRFEMINNFFPDFKNKPIYNDEGDPLVGWNKPETWRADARYAAMVVKVIALHQNVLFPQYPTMNFQLLSNDNGFMNWDPLSYFDERTLTARFRMNLTTPRSVEFVRKPVLSVMGLLSLVGSQQLPAKVMQNGSVVGNYSDVGVVASLLIPEQSPTRTYEVAFMVYRSNDTSSLSDNGSVCQLTWSHLPDLGTEAVFVHYQLDNSVYRSPYAVWKEASSPIYPSSTTFQEMRDAADSLLYSGPTPFLDSSEGSYNFLLPLPGVVLLHVCQKPSQVPSKVMNVRLHEVIHGETMIVWDDVEERCILTYEVAMSLEEEGTYTRVNSVDTIFSLYVHQHQAYSKLYYIVRAVDYWMRPGEYSDPVCSGC